MLREKLASLNPNNTVRAQEIYNANFVRAFIHIAPFFLTAMEPILDRSPFSVYCIDMKKRRFTYVSDSFCEMLGAHDLTEINQRATENTLFQDSDEGLRWAERVECTASGGPHPLTLKKKVADHFEPKYVFESSVSIYDQDGKPIYSVGFIQDANRYHEMEEKLRDMAYYDELTSLRNRKYIDKRLQEKMNMWQDASILMVDIDHFKSWNDEKGHQAGDGVLRQIGLQIKTFLAKDDIACRYGGEEILIALPVGLEIAKDIAERLRSGIAGIEAMPGKSRLNDGTALTVSVGVTSGKLSLNELIQQADVALYNAKEPKDGSQGRNRVVVYTDGMTMPDNGNK